MSATQQKRRGFRILRDIDIEGARLLWCRRCGAAKEFTLRAIAGAWPQCCGQAMKLTPAPSESGAV